MEARLASFRRIYCLALGLLILRLGQLQVVGGAAYRKLAEQNRLRVIPQLAPRGLIFDRMHRQIVGNQTIFRVAAVPQDLPRVSTGPPGTRSRAVLFARLGALVNESAEELEERFEQNRSMPFLPTELVADVPKAIAMRIEEERASLPGVVVESVVSRRYPLGSVASHLIGYLSQPSSEVFPILKQYGVHPKDLVGRAGLERELDAYLRGRAGGSLVEVNHRARQVRMLGVQEPRPGEPVTLTIDAHLQALIEQLFGQRPGACVVLQPFTGEVLAMVSAPGFDPQAFADQDQEAVQGFFDASDSPLMNRATAGMYQPGSIVKLVTGATALEHQIITRYSTIQCPGYVLFGDRKIHCWNRDGHGPVRLREALMGSCNVYFMTVGRWLGLERLRAGYMNVGFGRRSGWLLEEQLGHLPFSRPLSEGEVAILSIGQGEILITPIQAAVMVTAIANQGWLVEPWVVKRIGDHEVTRAHLIPVGWSRDTLSAVREGMDAVVNDPHGTGIRAHSDRVAILGKTGTAQTHVPGLPHGWFVGFCPAEQPMASFAILAEHGGSGGDLPATIGKAICEYLADQGNQSPVDQAGQHAPRG